jgi:hypothetical protein
VEQWHDEIPSLELVLVLGRIISIKLQDFNGVKLEDFNDVMVVLQVFAPFYP